MKKQPYSKRPYRFTVGLGEHGRHLLILAADERTRQWAVDLQARISILTRTVTDELWGKQVLEGDTVVTGPDVVDIEAVRSRFLELLVEMWPRASFVVELAPEETRPPVGLVMTTSTEAMHGVLAMLAGYAPVVLEKRS